MFIALGPPERFTHLFMLLNVLFFSVTSCQFAYGSISSDISIASPHLFYLPDGVDYIIQENFPIFFFQPLFPLNIKYT